MDYTERQKYNIVLEVGDYPINLCTITRRID